MVPSMITYSKSASSDNTAKICSKTPRLVHLRNRLKTEFHWPKDSGRSRQDPHNPQHSFQKEAIVRSRLPRISNFSRKKGSDAFPLLITQDHPIQDYLPIQEP